ncbi:hypothetical protein [Streptomyces flavidovirens]
MGELRLGGGQQVAGAGVDGFECGAGVGVALALAEAVGVVVVRPAVEAGVLVGVRVPGVEDLLAVADEGVEVAQEFPVSGGIEGNGEVSSRGSAANCRVGGDGPRRRRCGFRLVLARGADLPSDVGESGGVRLNDLLGGERARLLHDAVVSGAVVHAALERGAVGESGD